MAFGVRHGEFFESGKIDIGEARPTQRVSPERAEGAYGVDGECVGVEPACNLLAARAISRKRRVADDIGAVQSIPLKELSIPEVTVMGPPVCRLTIPLVCQPPRM